MSTAPTIPVLSRVLRERDALVAALERMRSFADHKIGCIWKRRLGTPVCDCGYNALEDQIANLLAGIPRSQS